MRVNNGSLAWQHLRVFFFTFLEKLKNFKLCQYIGQDKRSRFGVTSKLACLFVYFCQRPFGGCLPNGPSVHCKGKMLSAVCDQDKRYTKLKPFCLLNNIQWQEQQVTPYQI